MFEHFESAVVRPGNLRRVRLPMLPGAPQIDVEHVGDGNATWTAELARFAGKNPIYIAGSGPGGAQTEIEQAKQILRYREILAQHAVRHLVDVRRSDGTQAEDADIPKLCAALPDDVARRPLLYAVNADNFRGDVLPPEDLAGKF